MPATIELEDNSGNSITSFNFGSVGGISGPAYSESKFTATNVGDVDATNVQIVPERVTQNDGLDYTLIAPDSSGNPGTYSGNLLNIGTMAPGDVVTFWVRVSVPTGLSPAGNPRVFDIAAEYTGT